MANSEDTDEMLHVCTVCYLRQNHSSEKEIHYVMTCDPLIYTNDHSDFILCSFIENSIGPKMVNHKSPITYKFSCKISPGVYKTFSCSTQMSMNVQMLIESKMLNKNNNLCLLKTLRYCFYPAQQLLTF